MGKLNSESAGTALEGQRQPIDIGPTVGLLARLTRATVNYGIGRILPKVIGFFLIPLYTVFLTPHDYGIVALASSLSNCLVILMRFGVPGAVTRFYFDHKEGTQLRDYISTIHHFLFVSSVTVGGLVLALLPFGIGRLIPGLPYYPYVPMVVIAAIARANSDLQRRLIQAREQSSYSATLSVAFAVVSVALAVFFVAVLRMAAAGLVLSTTITAVLFCIQAQYYLRADIAGRFRLGMLRGSLGYAVGILPSHLINQAGPLVTQSVLSGLNSLGAVGLLSLATRFMSPLRIAASAFNAAYLPVYFSIRERATAGGDEKLAAIVRTIWFLAALGYLVVSLLGPALIVLMTPATYHGAARLLPVLGLRFLGNTAYFLLGAEIFYRKKTWILPLLTLTSMIVTLLITFATAEEYGPLGVAWGMAAGNLTMAGLTTVISVLRFRRLYDWMGLLRTTALVTAVTVTGLMLSGHAPWTDMAIGVSGVLLFCVVLWLLGDPTIEPAATAIQRRLTRGILRLR